MVVASRQEFLGLAERIVLDESPMALIASCPAQHLHSSSKGNGKARAAVREVEPSDIPIEEPLGLLKLFADFRQPEWRRSMALINMFLETLGSELKTRGECN